MSAVFDLPQPGSEFWSVEDYHAIPGDFPYRTSLVNGELVITAASPRPRHQIIGALLVAQIHAQKPQKLIVAPDVDVLFGQDPEATEIAPDIVVYDAAFGQDVGPIPAGLVTLVAEIVSPRTKRKDREVHPSVYEEFGVPHFWRVETPSTAGAFAVHVFALETGKYVERAVFDTRLRVEAPFPVDIDLTGFSH